MRLLVLLLFISTQALLSQDYLITTKGDTLKGSIVFRLNGKIESATVKGNKRETISALGSREVMMNGKRYKPVQFNASAVFMEILTDGYLSLLAFQPPNIMAYDGRLLQKRDGKILEVQTLGFKKNVSGYLSDYPDLAAKIKDGELDARNLNEIISQYNNFISDKSGAVRAQGKMESAQKSKIELLNSLKTEIENSSLIQKQDALDILTDWVEKIKTEKSPMPYMMKALRTALESRQDLLDKVAELAGN
jgi:hypothetical protein